MYTVKFKGKQIGLTRLEKGDPPMGVALGLFEPTCAIENTLGKPLNSEKDIKGWEGLEVYLSDGEPLECRSTYLEQFDLGEQGRIYQISCFVINSQAYEKHFQHHIVSYEDSFT